MENTNNTNAKESFKVFAYVVSALPIEIFFYLMYGPGAGSLFLSLVIASIPPLALAYYANNKVGREGLGTGIYVLLMVVFLLYSTLGFGLLTADSPSVIHATRLLAQFILMYVLIFFAIWLNEKKSTISRSSLALILLATALVLVLLTYASRIVANMEAKNSINIDPASKSIMRCC